MFLGDKLVYGTIPYVADEPDMAGLKKIITSKVNSAYYKSEAEEDKPCVAKKCKETGLCQETEGFKGTEHEGVDVCNDDCVHFSPFQEVKLHCVIEDLHNVFGSSAASNFTFGVNNGLVIGMLQCSQIPFTKIGPKKWQKEMWQGIRPVEIPVIKKKIHQQDKKGNLKYKVDTKATSLVAVKRLFPNELFLATERSKVPHDGIVDAVLLCEFCRRFLL